MGDRKKYSVSDSRLPAFTNAFRKMVDEIGGVSAMSEKTGISRPTINFWYNGQRTPDAENLIVLSSKLGVSADYLLGLSDAPTNDKTAAAAVNFTGLSFEAVQALHDTMKGSPGFFPIHPIYRYAVDYFISSGYLRKFAVLMTNYENAFRNVEQEKANRAEHAKRYQDEYGVTPVYVNTNPFEATREDKVKSVRNDLIELVFEITRRIEDGIRDEQKEVGNDGKH